jgi:hypothetical protein
MKMNRGLASVISLLMALMFVTVTGACLGTECIPASHSGAVPVPGKKAGDLKTDTYELINGIHNPGTEKTGYTMKAGSLTINITEPAEDDILPSGVPFDIGWNTTNATGTCTVELKYAEAGPSGPYFPIADSLPENGTHPFAPPPVPELWLRATTTDSALPPNNTTMVRHIYVHVVPAPVITITDPANMAVWRGSNSYYINWTSSGGTAPLKVRLDYSMTFPLQTSGVIVTGLPGTGSYYWKVNLPMEVLGGILQITATVTDANLLNATASQNVLLLPPFIVQVTPVSANLLKGEKQAFTAQAYDLALDGSLTPISSGIMYWWMVISTGNTTGNGTLSPIIGNKTTFTATKTGTCNLVSAGMQLGTMAIGLPGTASITIGLPPPPVAEFINPKGGERFRQGTLINVTWNISANVSSAPFTIDLLYSTNGGANFSMIVKGMKQTAPGTNDNYGWTIPTVSPGTDMRLRITVTDSFGQNTAATTGNFTVTKPEHLRVFYGHNNDGIVDSYPMALISIVTDGIEVPVSGVSVKWDITENPQGAMLQHLSSALTQTDREGKTKTYLYLGEYAGAYKVTATSDDIPGQSASFTVNALPDAPAKVNVFPRDIVLKPGTSCGFTAVVYDRHDNLVTNRSVIWSADGDAGVMNGAAFKAVAPGKVNVSATCDDATGKTTVTVSGNPWVRQVQPKNGAGNVSVDAWVIVTFSEDMDWDTVYHSVSVSPSLNAIIEGSGETMWLRPLPGKMLLPATKYTVTVKATCKDLDGEFLDGDGSGVSNGLVDDDYKWHFMTGDALAMPPQVISHSPDNTSAPTDSVIEVGFSATMNRTAVESAFSLILLESGNRIPGTFSWGGNDTLLWFKPNGGLSGQKQYRVAVDGSNAKGADGAFLDGDGDGSGGGTSNDSFIWDFVTAKTAPGSGVGTDFKTLSTALAVLVVLLAVLLVLAILPKKANASGKDKKDADSDKGRAKDHNKATDEKEPAPGLNETKETPSPEKTPEKNTGTGSGGSDMKKDG